MRIDTNENYRLGTWSRFNAAVLNVSLIKLHTEFSQIQLQKSLEQYQNP